MIVVASDKPNSPRVSLPCPHPSVCGASPFPSPSPLRSQVVMNRGRSVTLSATLAAESVAWRGVGEASRRGEACRLEPRR